MWINRGLFRCADDLDRDAACIEDAIDKRLSVSSFPNGDCRDGPGVGDRSFLDERPELDESVDGAKDDVLADLSCRKYFSTETDRFADGLEHHRAFPSMSTSLMTMRMALVPMSMAASVVTGPQRFPSAPSRTFPWMPDISKPSR